MTDDELNCKIAEKLGWTGIGGVTTSDPAPDAPWHIERQWGVNTNGEWLDLPNYAQDLNACHEVEMGLSHEDQVTFRMRLRRIADEPVHATARQRSEALLATLEAKEE